MALQPTPSASSPNQHAWRNSLVSALVLWVAISTLMLSVTRSPMAALSFFAPLALGGGVTALLAGNLRARWPSVAYPVLVLGIATAVNVPVLNLLF
jgi:hypothetical protein